VLGAGPPRPFLALRAAAAQVVVPQVPPETLLLRDAPNAQARDVICYLERVALHGCITLLPGVRTSDFLARQEGFFALRACRIVPALGGRAEPLGAILVNAGAVIAVTEDVAGATQTAEREAATPAPLPFRQPA
jgi:hypothetical protein